MAESQFRKELEDLINRHSKENGSDTPDFILARYLCNALDSFDAAVREREEWCGRTAKPTDLPEDVPFPTEKDMPVEIDPETHDDNYDSSAINTFSRDDYGE